MGCNCGERREQMRNVVAATRAGDTLRVRENLQAMGRSLAEDAGKLVPRRFRVRADVAKSYGITTSGLRPPNKN
jgi:hypothetical protein